MKEIVVLHLNRPEETATIHFMGQSLTIRHLNCANDLEKAHDLIAQYDGQVDAIALHGMPAQLELGPARRAHEQGETITAVAQQTPVLDGRIIRAGLERWAITLADRAQPGIFSRKHVLMTPGLNHNGLARALEQHGCTLRYADPFIFFNLPKVPGIGFHRTRNQAAPYTLDRLKEVPYQAHVPAGRRPFPRANHRASFDWADIIAGDIGPSATSPRRKLKRKIVVVETPAKKIWPILRARGVDHGRHPHALAGPNGRLGRWSAAAIEAISTALRPNPDAPLNEDTYLDLMAEIEWTPAIRVLQPENGNINRFAFVIHPLSVKFIHKDRPSAGPASCPTVW
jgi:hypothetical protein